MHIKQADIGNAKGIAQVHIDSWKTTYRGIVPQDYLDRLDYEIREQQWRSNIAVSQVFIAETEDKQVAGFSTGGKERTGNYGDAVGEVYAIYLLQEYQGRGFGKQLIKPIIDNLQQQEMDELIILALEDNPACGFYSNLGGKAIDQLDIEIAGKKLKETVFYWRTLKDICL